MGKGCQAWTNPRRNDDERRAKSSLRAILLQRIYFFFLNFIYFFFTVHDTRWLTCAVTHKTRDKPLAAFLLPFYRVLRDKAGRGHDRRACVRVRACTLDAFATTVLQKSRCCTGNATTRLHDIGASPTMQFATAWRNDLVNYALVHQGAPWLL